MTEHSENSDLPRRIKVENQISSENQRVRKSDLSDSLIIRHAETLSILSFLKQATERSDYDSVKKRSQTG